MLNFSQRGNSFLGRIHEITPVLYNDTGQRYEKIHYGNVRELFNELSTVLPAAVNRPFEKTHKGGRLFHGKPAWEIHNLLQDIFHIADSVNILHGWKYFNNQLRLDLHHIIKSIEEVIKDAEYINDFIYSADWSMVLGFYDRNDTDNLKEYAPKFLINRKLIENPNARLFLYNEFNKRAKQNRELNTSVDSIIKNMFLGEALIDS